MKDHEVAIRCRNCLKEWKLVLPLSGNQIGVIATVCECGSIIVGNYNSELLIREGEASKDERIHISKNEKYLSNGHFDFLELSTDELSKLPQLPLE